MYSTCLFCQRSLGRNDRVERFPVGRRLAFDAAKGRLWVVCLACGRWNLTPLEERWEAIEECERLFPGSARRAVTSNVTLARHPSGLELVRVGRPEVRELFACRWGRELRGRRLRHQLASGAGGAVALAALLAGPLVAIPVQIVTSALGDASTRRADLRPVTHVRGADGGRVLLRAGQLGRASLVRHEPQGWGLRVPLDPHAPAVRTVGSLLNPRRRRERGDAGAMTLVGPDARRVTTLVLARRNHVGGTADEIDVATRLLAGTRSREALVARTIAKLTGEAHRRGFGVDDGALSPAEMLMLEMAMTEDAEDVALTGDLAALEAAWRDAEEVAAIADGLLLPNDVDRKLNELRQH